MSQPPTYSSWKISCHSSEEAQALQQWLSSRIRLDRVLTDTVRVIPNGVEQVQTVGHRLGDYFASIRTLLDSSGQSCVIPACFSETAGGRPVLQRLDDEHLQEIEATPQKATIELDLKGELDSKGEKESVTPNG